MSWDLWQEWDSHSFQTTENHFSFRAEADISRSTVSHMSYIIHKTKSNEEHSQTDLTGNGSCTKCSTSGHTQTHTDTDGHSQTQANLLQPISLPRMPRTDCSTLHSSAALVASATRFHCTDNLCQKHNMNRDLIETTNFDHFSKAAHNIIMETKCKMINFACCLWCKQRFPFLKNLGKYAWEA